MTVWHLAIVAAVVVVAAGWLLWARHRPRIRPAEAVDLARTLERVERDRNRYRTWHWNHCGCHDSWDKCECASAGHPRDGSCNCCDLGTGICGTKPIDRHVDHALDVIAEPDHRRAEHMNRTLRRVTEEDA